MPAHKQLHKSLDEFTTAPIGLPIEAPVEAPVEVGRRLLHALLRGYSGPVAVRLWDGSYVRGGADAPATLTFRHPDPLRDLFLRGDLVRLGEAYLLGAVEVDGRMDIAFDIVDFLERSQPGRWERLRLAFNALRLPRADSYAALKTSQADGTARANGTASIRHHYDVSNDFYRLWLDPEMVYSCAYFRDTTQSLAEAQRDKLDYLCRKLRLEPGQRLLDIGCGWGALALWAARNYGVEVHGITLSEAQCDHARERIARAGFAERVRIELRDYRDLPPDAHYDRIVSVGMFEHIGVKNFPNYFGAVQRLLAPGGLFLNHGITNDCGWVDCASQRFTNRYVFPDGELTRVSTVQTAMEQAGFEILDVEGLRPHYALTLRRWLQALEASRERADALVGPIVRRIWRLYMAGSAHYFQQGSLGVYQILAGHSHAPQPLPLRRDDLYRT
ncbi:MAG: cyclopropane-fatty-acyl-phospholipid synthase family protein [Gammaproteobacteria bacterium]|nr:cyclopropane-fatty-acyl-phospholipid synthase family protein [Gammaproteobacteria bacterium]